MKTKFPNIHLTLNTYGCSLRRAKGRFKITSAEGEQYIIYGMLYHSVETVLLRAGLDPYLPLLHRDAYGKPAFVYDFIQKRSDGLESHDRFAFSRKKVFC